MANLIAVKPTKLDTEKLALPGTLMLKRADVLGLVRKLLHYADNNIAQADSDGRGKDAETQRARRRVIVSLREGLKCLPMFENPELIGAIPYSEAEAFIRARNNGSSLIDIPRSASGMEARRAAAENTDAVHDSPVAESETPK